MTTRGNHTPGVYIPEYKEAPPCTYTPTGQTKPCGKPCAVGLFGRGYARGCVDHSEILAVLAKRNASLVRYRRNAEKRRAS
jgi:hypothetical protein